MTRVAPAGLFLVVILDAVLLHEGSCSADSSAESHELFPRVPLVRWAHIQRTFEDDAAPFNASTEGYREVAEMLSDASEIGGMPGREDEGLEMMRVLVHTWPQHQAATKVYLAFALMFSGKDERLPEAQQLLEEALSGWNRNLMAHNNLGVVLEAQGHYHDAHEAYAIGAEAANIECFLMTPCANAGAPIFANLGRSLRRSGDVAASSRAYMLAARLALGQCAGGADDQHHGLCPTADSRYYRCLAMQAQAESSVSHGDSEAAALLLRTARWSLVASMIEPGFRFDPVPELLYPQDAEWLRQVKLHCISTYRVWYE